jgi:signal transduction histidine kinase
MDAIRLSPPRRLSLPVANDCGAGRISVLDFGDPIRPVDLVFVHANGFNALTYRTLLAPLSGSLRIWSNGQAIDPTVESHLFEPFFSSESRSSGLGLYICRELCERHGALLGYAREASPAGGGQGEGNVFFVDFKLQRAMQHDQSTANTTG